MHRKGVSDNPVMYIVLIIAFVLILLFGFTILTQTTKSETKIELTNFIISLNKAILQQREHSYDSSSDLTLGLPNDITEVCILDRSRKLDRFSNTQLTSVADIYPESNLFFSPDAKYMPGTLQNAILEQSPLCIKTDQGKIKLTLTSKGNVTKIAAPEQEINEKDCVSLIYNGDSNNKIDIVFMGQNYANAKEFIPAVDNYIQNALFATEPFKTNAEKFNLYRIDDFSDLNCKTDGYIYCDEYNVKQRASNCPNDYIIVLMKRSKVIDLASPLRSSAYSNIINLNTADDNLVIMHELGHAFANLADEYVDDSYYVNFNEKDYANCADDTCSKWRNIEGTGCFKGCSLSSFYRATQKSIMNNYLISNEYGSVNTNVILKRLGVYG